MKMDVTRIDGSWNLGYILDKHTIKSAPAGYYENGRTKWAKSTSVWICKEA